MLRLDRIQGIANKGHIHREAQREELQVHLLRGEPRGVSSWDNDALHMEVLDTYRAQLGGIFDKQSEIVRAVIQDHYEAHKSQFIEKLLEQQELALIQQTEEETEQVNQESARREAAPQPQQAGVEQQ